MVGCLADPHHAVTASRAQRAHTYTHAGTGLSCCTWVSLFNISRPYAWLPCIVADSIQGNMSAPQNAAAKTLVYTLPVSLLPHNKTLQLAPRVFCQVWLITWDCGPHVCCCNGLSKMVALITPCGKKFIFIKKSIPLTACTHTASIIIPQLLSAPLFVVPQHRGHRVAVRGVRGWLYPGKSYGAFR